MTRLRLLTDESATTELAPLDVLLIRHAEATQPATPGWTDDDRPLSSPGRVAARELANELEPYQINAIYSSPYPRSVETVRAIAQRRGMRVHVIEDLRERRISGDLRDDWRLILERAWEDFDFAAEGGETARDAQRRALAVLDLLRTRHPDGGRLVVGSHGNLISLILQALEPGVDFAFHMAMPMPAVYRLTHDGRRWRVMGGYGFTPLEGQALP